MTFRHHARKPHENWIVVADRAHARILTTEKPDLSDLREIKTLIHPPGASHPRDVLTDRPGRFPGNSGECASGDSATDYRHQTAQDFAVEVIAALEHGRNHQQFGQLVLIAPPLFLGVLREHLSGPLQKLVKADFAKELVQASLEEIGNFVRHEMQAKPSTAS